jgi:tetratricopeptide (TPR) repeat protein
MRQLNLKNVAVDFVRSVIVTVTLLAWGGALAQTTAEDYVKSGNAWFSKGDFDRAIADYTQALRINPQNTQAKENLATVQRLAANSQAQQASREKEKLAIQARLVAEAGAERKKRQEPKIQLAQAKERETQAAEVETEHKRRQELEIQLAQAKERERQAAEAKEPECPQA